MALLLYCNWYYKYYYFVFLVLVVASPIGGVNITEVLSAFPELSEFSALLSSSSVAGDLSRRSSVTILAVPNWVLSRRQLSPWSVADVVRYHVLLQYLSQPELREIPPSGELVATLFGATGRASGIYGSVNVSRDREGLVWVRSPAAQSSPWGARVVEAIPEKNVSIVAVEGVLVPAGVEVAASEAGPPPGVNISRALEEGHNFNVAASMLAASGVVGELERDEGGAGITLFVPTDAAFAAAVRLQSLSAESKAVVLRFHVLHSYYPLGSLESIVNPLQPTLATEHSGAGSFTLNISRGNDSVAINTGIVQASVTQTVFDQKPVAIFGVSKVLLPREMFEIGPVTSPSPEGAFGPSSTPGFREEIASHSQATNTILTSSCCCIGLLLLFLSL